MVVRTIKARRDRKTGNIAITFTVCPKTWASMAEEAKAARFFGTADFVAGVLNAQLIAHEPARPFQGSPEPPLIDDDLPF